MGRSSFWSASSTASPCRPPPTLSSRTPGSAAWLASSDQARTRRSPRSRRASASSSWTAGTSNSAAPSRHVPGAGDQLLPPLCGHWPARSTSSASWQGGAGWPRPPCPRRSSGGHPQLHRDHAALLAVHGPLQEGLRVGTRKGAKPSEDPHRGALAARVRGGLRQVPRVRPHPMIKVEQMMAGAHALQPFTFPAQHVDSYKLDTQRDRQGPRRGLPCEPDRARPQRALQHLLPICRLCFSPSLQNSCFYTNSSQSNAEV